MLTDPFGISTDIDVLSTADATTPPDIDPVNMLTATTAVVPAPTHPTVAMALVLALIIFWKEFG